MSAKTSLISDLVISLAEQLTARKARFCCAESCTGGLIAAACTELAGSSAWFERGFVTYSNKSKRQMLGVPAEVLLAAGAVSGETVAAMVSGALAHSDAEYAVAVSGIAGPGGATADKPVGTVWMAWEGPEFIVTERFQFDGDRSAVRQAAVQAALTGLLEWVTQEDQ